LASAVRRQQVDGYFGSRLYWLHVFLFDWLTSFGVQQSNLANLWRQVGFREKPPPVLV
jgi:hypothetical protein